MNSYESVLGTLLLVSDGTALTGLYFEDQKHLPDLSGIRKQNLPVFDETAAWLDLYFQGRIPEFAPPLSLHGSSFRLAVWNILLSIPYGKVITYGKIAFILAERSGCRQSAQAVGGAVGHNPVSIIIPCHRVIGSNGRLTGYAAGLSRKEALLALEQKNRLIL